MSSVSFTGVVAFASLLFSIVLFAARWNRLKQLSWAKDLSIPKDSAARGIRYAFTVGMAPWAKESTRRHMVAYLRGIAFHIGIFAGLLALFLSPWLEELNADLRLVLGIVAGVGALMGIAGAALRIAESNLRSLSTPDDHASVWLVSLFLTTVAISFITLAWLPLMYIVASLMLVYAPLGKIRHCIYYYFGRLFYGVHIGRRGVVRGLEAHHGK